MMLGGDDDAAAAAAAAAIGDGMWWRRVLLLLLLLLLMMMMAMMMMMMMSEAIFYCFCLCGRYGLDGCPGRPGARALVQVASLPAVTCSGQRRSLMTAVAVTGCVITHYKALTCILWWTCLWSSRAII
jgi:hypothetical protein